MFMSTNTVTTPVQQPTHQQLQQSFSANNLIGNLSNNSNKGGGDPPLSSGSGNGSASKDRKRKRTVKDKDNNSNNAPTSAGTPTSNTPNQNNCNDILGIDLDAFLKLSLLNFAKKTNR